MTPRRALVLLSVLLLHAAAGQAQIRTIPDEAKRGYLRPVQGMAVSFDGKPVILAPGATIRDWQNLVVVPASLPREGAWAEYLEDTNGQVSRVWLLRPEEQARPERRARR